MAATVHALNHVRSLATHKVEEVNGERREVIQSVRENRISPLLIHIGIGASLLFLPLVTGYMAYHRLGLDYTSMLAVHILSVELLMVALPFTNLTHAFTFMFARWYTN